MRNAGQGACRDGTRTNECCGNEKARAWTGAFQLQVDRRSSSAMLLISGGTELSRYCWKL
jgi:hypothetical protein